MIARTIASWFRRAVAFALVLAVTGTAIGADASTSPEDEEARRIVDAAGIHGGLVVHIGCGDGKLTAALRINDRYIVHGLDKDAKSIDKARDYIKSQGLYGKVSVRRFDGRQLPYAENLVNLVVAEKLYDVSMAEVMRVLCPRGVAYVKRGTTWTKTVKPWPEDI
ncbi:MAG: class I SAM-dependent methyltransferase, partial [Planctomycetota bacterium]